MESRLFAALQPWITNEELLRQRMAGRMDLWEECVMLLPTEEFFEEPDQWENSRNSQASPKEVQQKLWQRIHRLKGDLAHFGFDRTAARAARLCALLREEQPEPEAIWEDYEGLKTEYLQIVERIKVTR